MNSSIIDKPNFVILDFEATCDDRERHQPRPQEIIEFASLIYSHDFKIVDEFEAFVKPYHHPILTEFCKEFTSITQRNIDTALPFIEVFKNHQQWLDQHNITIENAFFVTCGNWDLGKMLPAQCASAVPRVKRIPPFYMRWHNIKESFFKVRGQKKLGLKGMVKAQGLQMIGHHHRGIDDCRTIAELLRSLLNEGIRIEFTDK
ncbi:MAG: exonuclease domain-containing protein [Desulfobacterales bacterium]|nr:exonuclease domain-containing protein [Desulfobacterales bacterium]